jgi:hypothetical protein
MLWITSWEEDREESMAGHPRGRVADSMYQLHFLIPIFCGRTNNSPKLTGGDPIGKFRLYRNMCKPFSPA